MGMIGHVSAGPLRACVNVDDCCDPFSAGTLTRVNLIETVLRATLPPNACGCNSGSFFYFGEED
jgi:hypothetical protein